jgi:hypothetical protein
MQIGAHEGFMIGAKSISFDSRSAMQQIRWPALMGARKRANMRRLHTSTGETLLATSLAPSTG